jgi:glycosyltransferase involved in cell wall biosynthesis
MKDFSDKTISVIISAYNEEKYIDYCLLSLEKQDYKNHEVIVVDDGSSDQTKGIVKQHNCKLVALNHLGTAIARNTGAKQAKGEILVFLDADMEFAPDFITKLTEPIRSGKTKGTFSKLEYVKNWDKPLARLWNWTNPRLPDKLRVEDSGEVGEDFRSILKSEFERVNGFDNIGYTDTWSLKHKLGYKPTNAPNAIYYHYNPETYKEVLESARWIGKRKYKGGKFGTVITMFKSIFIFSIVKGLKTTILKNEPRAIIFYLYYDFGIFFGALESLFFSNRIK